ncbi:MAG: sugar phosphate isomerase/epimerase [Anaerolineae bacterium]|nr:sugar phosphate isomerase/epimerase [Anaerolineae bacterium]
MRFGCCTGVENAQRLADVGYDFIELSVTGSLQPEASDEEWASTRVAIEALPLRPAAFNIMLPREIKVTGPAVDAERIQSYVQTAFQRATTLGGEVIVFGSGGSRNVPDGFPRERAWEQLIQFVQWAGDAAQSAGMILAIEPLNQGECNIINSVTEALRLARDADHPAVKVLADLYHIMVESESINDVIAAGDMLAHVHVADTGRRYPGSGSYPYSEFLSALKAIGYDQRISVECRWRDFATESQAAVAFLRERWEKG